MSKEQQCTWEYLGENANYNDWGYWVPSYKTECGNQYLIESLLIEKIKFCPFCGGEIKTENKNNDTD